MALELSRPNLRSLRDQLGLSQEAIARALDVSTRSIERWETGAGPEKPETLRRISELEAIASLGRQVYGDDFRRFMEIPRRSLGDRTPRAAVIRGEAGAVLSVLAQAYEGQSG